MVALAVILGETLARKLAQEMGLHEFPAELRKPLEIIGQLRERQARKVETQKFGVARPISRGVEHGVDVAEDFFGGIVVLVLGVDEGAKVAGEVLSAPINF